MSFDQKYAAFSVFLDSNVYPYCKLLSIQQNYASVAGQDRRALHIRPGLQRRDAQLHLCHRELAGLCLSQGASITFALASCCALRMLIFSVYYPQPCSIPGLPFGGRRFGSLCLRRGVRGQTLHQQRDRVRRLAVPRGLRDRPERVAGKPAQSDVLIYDVQRWPEVLPSWWVNCLLLLLLAACHLLAWCFTHFFS